MQIADVMRMASSVIAQAEESGASAVELIEVARIVEVILLGGILISATYMRHREKAWPWETVKLAITRIGEVDTAFSKAADVLGRLETIRANTSDDVTRLVKSNQALAEDVRKLLQRSP